MKASIVIPTRNRSATLMQTLDALAAQERAPAFEVLVVDNGSSDDTQTALSARRDAFELRAFFAPEPNRGAARNLGIAQAKGEIVIFIDDDVIAPPQFVAAHIAAHADGQPRAVTGPILNVASLESRPLPDWKNASRAFFCTCNASAPLADLRAVGGFDEAFTGYGWEDTELGVRLRHRGLQHGFAWDGYVYHLKPDGWESLAQAEHRMREKARMAKLFTEKQPEARVRMATGNYGINKFRGRMLAPDWLLPIAASLAERKALPQALRAFARGHYLDGIYVQELCRKGAAR